MGQPHLLDVVWFKFPRIQTVQKDRVSKPSHGGRLRQPSYGRLGSSCGKKRLNYHPIFSEGVLCFELVVVENAIKRTPLDYVF